MSAQAPFWLPDEDERLTRLRAEGKTAGQIGEIVPGRTLNAIKGRIQLLGLKSLRPRPDAWPPERDELLRQLWCVEGLSKSKIAARMPGLTPNAVIGRVHRLGLSKASRAEATRAQQHVKPPKPIVERRRSRPRNMIRFGSLSIPKSVIPAEMPELEQPSVKGVTLEERRADQCGWPINDGGPYLYCGAERAGHRRYCDRHAWVGVAGPRSRRVA